MQAKKIIIDGVEYNLIPASHNLFIVAWNGKRYYLGPEAEKTMYYEEAQEWCKSLGENYELPSRIVMLMCYNNKVLRERFKMDDYYWTSEEQEYNSAYGWVQGFFNGVQSYHRKDCTYRVRAVRVE